MITKKSVHMGFLSTLFISGILLFQAIAEAGFPTCRDTLDVKNFSLEIPFVRIEPGLEFTGGRTDSTAFYTATESRLSGFYTSDTHVDGRSISTVRWLSQTVPYEPAKSFFPPDNQISFFLRVTPELKSISVAPHCSFVQGAPPTMGGAGSISLEPIKGSWDGFASGQILQLGSKTSELLGGFEYNLKNALRDAFMIDLLQQGIIPNPGYVSYNMHEPKIKCDVSPYIEMTKDKANVVYRDCSITLDFILFPNDLVPDSKGCTSEPIKDKISELFDSFPDLID